MIATVRIAPVEQWCEATVPHRDDGEVGLTVQIHTDSMSKGRPRSRSCEGRSWILTADSADMLSEITGVQYARPLWICEHMLEMD